MAKDKPKIDPNFEKYIKEYANQIETIKSFAEAVRRIPGEYIGHKGNKGWKSCIREIFQNSFDECVRVQSPCHYVRLVFDERNQSALIEDQGRGIPFGKMIEVYSTQHSSSNYTKQPGNYTSGVHGVGSGVAMALSKNFIVDSYVLGEGREIRFAQGILWKFGEKKIKCPDGRQGTTVFMEPDIEVLGNVNLTCGEVFELVKRIYSLSNIGDRFDFIGHDKTGRVVISEKLINKDGLLTNFNGIIDKPIVTPISFKDDNGLCKAEVIMCYDVSSMSDTEDIDSYANYSPTADGGTHVDGFLDGICQYFRNYMNKIFIPEKSKITVTNADVKTGLKAVISACCLNPVFAGQFKGILTSEEMLPFIKNLTLKSLDEWGKTKPNDLQKVAKYLKDVAEVRIKSTETKVKLSANYEQSALGGFPKKFIRPAKDKGDIEFFIVEGDSAVGGLNTGRDSKTQGIYPIRGKLPNAFAKNKLEILKNQEVAGLVQLTTGDKVYHKDFDVKQVRWKKIIILTDADPDKLCELSGSLVTRMNKTPLTAGSSLFS